MSFYGMLQNGCLLFSAIGSPTPFPHSVSGPRSCVCGGPGACTSDEDNLVDTALGVEASASKSSIRRFVITEKAHTRAFSWLKSGYYRFHI